MHSTKRRSALLALAVTLCLCCAFVLTGCLDSPVLVNRVLDPTSDNIDYDNPMKNYVLDPEAILTPQDIAEATEMSVEEIEEVLYDQAVYDTDESKVNTSQAAQSGSLSNATTSQTTAPKQQNTPDGKTAPSSKDNTHDKDDGGSDSGDTGSTDEGSGGGGDNPEQGEDDTKATEPGTTYNAHGKTEDLPTNVESVCALGDTATMVCSIAGTDRLVGAPEEFLNNANLKKVLGEEALAHVSACWKGSGTATEDIDVPAIIALHPTAVLATTGYAPMTPAIQQELQEAGISIIAMPQLTSDAYIKKTAQVIGHLFTDVTEGASAQKASDYTAMVDSVLDAAKATHGGTVSTYNGVDYNNVTDPNPTNPTAGGPTNWTVLISGWDDDAEATAMYNGEAMFQDTGVALAHVGWKQSPVSYYLGCGGAVNNAAAYATYSSESLRMFLNYNENQVSYSWQNLDEGVSVGKDGGSFRQGGTFLLTNACDARGNETEHHLGSSDFNKVIVKTREIGNKLDAARRNPLGLYTPGAYRTETSVNGYGIVKDSILVRCYSVVTNALRNDTLYDIVVNPCGLAGSWTDGSMESFLEAAWSAHVFCGYDETALRQNITQFYETFYGYTLSTDEVDAILSGDYAQG